MTYKPTGLSCDHQSFTSVCDNDAMFYQLCGFIPLKVGHVGCVHENENGYGYCGNYICHQSYVTTVFSDVRLRDHGTCNGRTWCDVNKSDELGCDEGERFRCVLDGALISVSKRCDGYSDCSIGEDEVGCNHTYGLECKYRRPFDPVTYEQWVSPELICDGKDAGCYYKEDEEGCNERGEMWCERTEGNTVITKYLRPDQLCGHILHSEKLCNYQRDQLNCSNGVLQCKVKGYMTRVSMSRICNGYLAPICDDRIDGDHCVVAEQDCKVHKHLLCDEKEDCKKGGDEKLDICKNKTEVLLDCDRRVGGNSSRIPLEWLCDGVRDCVDGKDEDKDQWRVCGKNGRQRCIPKDEECEELYKCNDGRFVSSRRMCDNVETCAQENAVCHAAQSITLPLTAVLQYRHTKRIGYCLPGHTFPCITKVFNKLEKLPPHLVPPYTIHHPAAKLRCSYLYGEQYVYTACSQQCEETNISCPLTPLTSASCIFSPHKVLVPSLTDELTVVIPTKGGWTNDVFSCDNGQCVEYSKVCLQNL